MTFTLYENGTRLELTQEEFEDFILKELNRILTTKGAGKHYEYCYACGKITGLALGGVLTEDQALALLDLARSADGQSSFGEPLAKTESAQRKQIRDILNADK